MNEEAADERVDPTGYAVHTISAIIEHLETVPKREIVVNTNGLIQAHLKLGDLILEAIRADA